MLVWKYKVLKDIKMWREIVYHYKLRKSEIWSNRKCNHLQLATLLLVVNKSIYANLTGRMIRPMWNIIVRITTWKDLQKIGGHENFIEYLHSWQYLTSMCHHIKIVTSYPIKYTRKKKSTPMYQELLDLCSTKKLPCYSKYDII